jgi:hypothetical protein
MLQSINPSQHDQLLCCSTKVGLDRSTHFSRHVIYFQDYRYGFLLKKHSYKREIMSIKDDLKVKGKKQTQSTKSHDYESTKQYIS